MKLNQNLSLIESFQFIVGMGRYRYRKYQHIGTFFSIGIIGIGIGKQKYVELLYPLVSAVLAVSAKASIGISAKVWYRPTPNVLHKKLPKSFARSCIELCGGKGVSLKTKTWSKLVKWVLEWVVVSQPLGHFRVLRMGRAESQILVTHSHLTNFGWSGELHHDLPLVTLPNIIKKLVN